MCDDDIDLKKDSNFNFQKRWVRRSSKRFKKESVVVDIEGLGEQLFITKFVTKITSFVIGKTVVE